MSKKKAEIKSLGRLIVNTYPDGVKVLNQVYDVEEHDKTYRILKKNIRKSSRLGCSNHSKTFKKRKSNKREHTVE